MKELFLLPLICFAFNCSLPQQKVSVKKASKYTVYVQTHALPHHCTTVEYCKFEGMFVFYTTTSDQKIRLLEKMHFAHPNWDYQECLTIFNKQQSRAIL